MSTARPSTGPRDFSGRHWVYRAFDDEGRLLYVGCSKDPRFRWKQHLFEHTWWAQRAVRWSLRVYPTKADALRAEKQAILTEHPLHNWQWRWEGRSSWGRQQYVDYVRALLEIPWGYTNPDRRARIAAATAAFEALYGEDLGKLVGRVRAGYRRQDCDSYPTWRTA